MEAYGLCREKFSSVLSGIGAAMKGATWNSIGIEMIYTASNRSLAITEVAVHMSLATLPEDYIMMTIHIPDDIAIKRMTVSDLPKDWNMFPVPPSTQAVGDRFVSKNLFCLLQISSSVTQGDYNLLLNPYHAEFKRIKILDIKKFIFDQRLFK